MTDLADLRKRVKSASGPDPAIDAAITAWLANAIVKPYPPSDDFGPKDRWQFWSEDGKHFLGSEGRFKVKPVTGSTEAALSLAADVLPGWLWRLMYNGEQYTYTSHPRRIDGEKWGHTEADAATPALAICDAVLRAKIELTP